MPGATFELVWHNDELSASPTERPAGWDEEYRASCTVTEAEPPHHLTFRWPGSGVVTFTLEPMDDEVLLTVTHRQVPGDILAMVAAGWHMHVDILVARLAGTTPASYWLGWRQLHDDYIRRLAG